MFRIPTTEGHMLANGQPHIPNPAERLVRDTRQIIQVTLLTLVRSISVIFQINVSRIKLHNKKNLEIYFL